jgi:hypothetical protein
LFVSGSIAPAALTPYIVKKGTAIYVRTARYRKPTVPSLHDG